MKTAMQQMIDILQRQINHLENTREEQGLSEIGKGALFALQSRLIDAEELLEAEKKQIMEAYEAGHLDGYELGKYNEDEIYPDSSYYQQTYNQEQ